MSNNNPLIGSVSDECSGVSFALPKNATVRLSDRERVQRDPDEQTNGETIKGTPASNTVPNNCNSEYFKLLRFGVDSLYLSYSGELLPDVDDKLKELKQIAQSPEPFEQVKAQYPINGHIFEVKDKGARLFPYILEDNAFRIQLSRSQSVPLAYVKISSEYI